MLLAISSVLFEKAPFKNCIVLGHVNDKDGIKMSKHKGNVVDPWSVLDKQGADAVRWYFYTSSAPWLPSRFAPEIVSEVQRKFLGTLWNTYAFFVLYAEIDKYDPSLYDIANVKLSVMDRWILSELNTLIDFVDKGLDKYNITDTSRAIEKFTDNLSNWYVRRCRERFWGSDMSEDKIAAYTTLYTALTTLAKLAAPFVPFITEQIYGNLVLPFYKNVPVSVHLTSFPVCDKAFIDTQLGENMDRVINIVSLGRTARNACAIKNRQPLSELLIRADKFDSLPEEYLDILKEELNVKKVAFISDSSGFASYEIKPQLRTLGPKYGPLIGKIREYLAQCDSTTLVNAVRKGEAVIVSIDNTPVAFKEEDLLISDKNKEGYQTVSEKGITVILNTELSQELIQEGLMRELVSKIQTMRKESGFNVTDHIAVTYSCGEKLAEVIEKYKSEIMQDTLADSVTAGSGASLKDINGEEISLSLEVVG